MGFPFYRSLVVPAAALFLANLVDLLLTVRAARKIDPEVHIRPALPRDRGEIVAAFRDGGAQLAVNLSVVTALRVDLFVLVRVAPLSIVAAYGVAGRAVDMSYLIAKQATVALMPRLGDPAQRAGAVRIGTGVFAGVIFSGMAALAINGQGLLVVWVGDVAAGSTPALVLMLLAGATVIMSTYEVASSMVMLSARTGWYCAVPIMIGSAVNLAISVGGASTYGIWAVAGSTVVGNSIIFFLMWWTARPLLGWRYRQVLGALAPGLSAAVTAGAVALLLRGFGASSLLGAFISCAITGLIGLVAASLVLKATAPAEVSDEGDAETP
ncbi:MAG: hypothetical protein JRH11_28000 [Deltaproteobacteria bacterium]|nr:hypothetical protein [Deltaproteobacteria bacterium]